ncbi:glycosyl hydrolase family 30 TIM-barrel domain-containing protein [Ditylenchus destructor]|uniref:Glucosylceramidase n=1 Tax=Ditylenchus destructor TaxID=166010 RepID=A0AAD4RBK7_9BILA|nr:glycosyl hydrolase family 30 TIM-barrel domain-containing protein [Ditylenchus destructor]
MNRILWFIIDGIAILITGGIIAFLSVYYSQSTNGIECNKRYFTPSSIDANALDSFVCVCTADSCDSVIPVGNLEEGDSIAVYQSSKEADRMRKFDIRFVKDQQNWGNNKIPSLSISIDGSQQFQTIFGFGGAFTDAAGININSLSDAAQEVLMEQYFGDKGINYTIGRVPIASSDFSTRVYSYLDRDGDFECESFTLAPEDFSYKIPYILKASKLSKGRLKLFASPWSAPGWMKTNGQMKGGAPLKGEVNGKYYKTYSKYLIRFFEEYWKHGITFWAMTIQNEPSNGLKSNFRYQSTNWSSLGERSFAAKVLKPDMQQSTAAKDVKIISLDDNRDLVLQWAKDLYTNDTAKESDSIDGIGIHWYEPGFYEDLSKVHDIRPDKFILATEACAGFMPADHIPLLGDWRRGEQYGHDIINDLRNWAIGWTDWNLVLDQEGGPNWVLNDVDAPIIVNRADDEFYKQPLFYFLGHFSKFIPRGSIRIASESSDINWADLTGNPNPVEHVAFQAPDGSRILVVMNADSKNAFRVTLKDNRNEGKIGQLMLPSNSITTLLYTGAYPKGT